MGGKSGKSQTIGYHYLFDILFGIGRGPLDELVAIKIGDKMAWQSSMVASGNSAINQPNLFGGEKKEGGIQGPFRLNMGEATQVLPGATAVNVSSTPASVGGVLAVLQGVSGPYSGSRVLPGVKESVGGLVSEFRGVVTLWFSGLISSMNPYPKEWKFRVRRTDMGWQDDNCWYPEKAAIWMGGGTIKAMNPAHIIYECLTNKAWGRGLHPALVDGDDGGSFVAAANTLCSEEFGLCLKWARTDDVDVFIKLVLDHIGGALYLDPATGRETLRLIRNDYVAAELPLFTPSSGLLEIKEDDSSSSDTAFNEVIATGHDPVTDTDIQIRVHNLAARHSQGAANAEDKGYPGIPTKGLLTRVAQRDLRAHASGLKKFTVILDRRAHKITPGACFRISDPRRGIGEIVLRAGEISKGSIRQGRITVKAIQDVYGMPATSFVTSSESTWTAPPTQAQPAPASIMVEMGYRDLLIRTSAADMAALAPDASFAGVLGSAPNTTTLSYELITRVAGEPDFGNMTSGQFTGTGNLAAAITALQTVFVLEDVAGIDESNAGEAILVEDEIMQLVSFVTGTNTATVTRGVADTIPAVHPAGARVWTQDDDMASDGRTYVDGETVEAKLLTRTSSDVLTEVEATTETITLVGRQARPYPPANVAVNGDSIFALTDPSYTDPEFTWAHRDRTGQEDQLIPHGDPTLGPEAGTTYNIRIYLPDDLVTPIREVTEIAGDTWTYLAADQMADGSPTTVHVELESERDGFTSLQKYHAVVRLVSGYGVGYGLNYGGA